MSYIYIVHSPGIPLYKIGHSKNPAQRLREFQKGCPTHLHLLHHFPAERAKVLERALHGAYAKSRVFGEWFALSRHDLVFLCNIIRADANECLRRRVPGDKGYICEPI